MPAQEMTEQQPEAEFAGNPESKLEVDGREARLVEAIGGLLDALERCGGDPPDCPYCGPARAFAEELLGIDYQESRTDMSPDPRG
jgi:hypothetical protein